MDMTVLLKMFSSALPGKVLSVFLVALKTMDGLKALEYISSSNFSNVHC